MSRHVTRALALAALALGAASTAQAQVPTPGDFLVTGSLGTPQTSYVREYTPSGALVRQLTVPYPGADSFEAEAVRGVTVDGAGRIAVYHGTFTPYLSVYSPATQTWTQQTLAGWNTANNVSYGGIAAYGRSVFAPDNLIGGDTSNGVVQFNPDTGTAQRFGAGIDAISVTLGQDGLLYALSGTGSPSGRTISVFNPATDALVRTVTTPQSILYPAGGGDTIVNGIAVNAQGQIFLGKLYGALYKLAPDGTILASAQLTPDANSSFFESLTLGASGDLALAQSDGRVVSLDQSFANIRSFQTYNYYVANSFVAFVPAPEPGVPAALSVGVLSLGVLALKARRRRSAA